MNRRKVCVCVCRIRFQETDSPRDKHDSPARTWSHPHATRPHLRAHTRTRPRAHARPDARRRPRPFMLRFLKGLHFQLSIFLRFQFFGFSKTFLLQKKKPESEHRAQQERGSNARYHQHVLMRLRSARGGAERCACQWLRVPCDEVVKQCVVPWTWSLLYVPMK